MSESTGTLLLFFLQTKKKAIVSKKVFVYNITLIVTILYCELVIYGLHQEFTQSNRAQRIHKDHFVIYTNFTFGFLSWFSCFLFGDSFTIVACYV